MPRAPSGLSPPFFFLLMAALASIANTTANNNNNNNRNNSTANAETTTATAAVDNHQPKSYYHHHNSHRYYYYQKQQEQQQQKQFEIGPYLRVGAATNYNNINRSKSRNGRISRSSSISSSSQVKTEIVDEQSPSPLEQINPWLSACDLQPASATDLQGACTTASAGPGSKCPPPCPANSTTQCLHYLQESHKERLCGEMNPQRRQRELQGLRMRHCCEHAVDSALVDPHLEDAATCRQRLEALLEVDALAARVSCEFAEILTRYDCTQTYSIKHRCEDCKEAYRRWVCSSLVPHFTSPGHRVRPCLNVCQNVEKQCPYMLPGDRAPAHPTQYAGEPTFLCLDPNIPESGEQRSKSSQGDEDCCYTHCGTPGRGLCAKCANASSVSALGGIVTPAWVQCASPAAQRTPPCRAASSGAQTTHNRKVVHPLWTAWIILIHTQTIIDLFKCLLAVCATSVRRRTMLFALMMTRRRRRRRRRERTRRRRTPKRRRRRNGKPTTSSSWS
ncbi:uncharacterized protein [Onthophagus taurus]|uniref:uncharacterized protein n=1 Tax=Onthophagus taurus TaxID=166361 RepID=UPI000C1FFB99|nr:uncharacterized protein LOC111423708 [Onthophagus taurus]